MKNNILKRAFDIFLSGTGLLVSLPLWIVIVVLILVFDGRPLFFVQKRIGRGGKVFDAYKFRTMRNGEVTPVGRILRATALDELPQLWNIFKGDMSFVGPRALAEEEYDEIDGVKVNIREVPGFEKRVRVRPGLTGLAQVYARKNIPLKYKIKYDILYVNKANICLDLKLIFLSFIITFFGAWEDRTRLPRALWRVYRVK